MNVKRTYKRIKRRFKKKMYLFLVKINAVDFSRFRPLLYLTLITGILFILAKLPTPETDNRSLPQTAYCSTLSAKIRSYTLENTTHSADVIVLFLSKNSAGEPVSLEEDLLYSFYLTGKELVYLAEGATAFQNFFIHLDGLNYTCHKNRLPFNRVTSLSLSSGAELTDNQLYHVLSTEDIFSLFHYISYRTLGIMHIYPKDAAGNLLSDYQKSIFKEIEAPLTIHTATDNSPLTEETPVSVVTIQRGFNIISLIKKPNKIALCIYTLFLALICLIWYMVPRLHRICIWFRIYRIRSKKHSARTFYRLKK